MLLQSTVCPVIALYSSVQPGFWAGPWAGGQRSSDHLVAGGGWMKCSTYPGQRWRRLLEKGSSLSPMLSTKINRTSGDEQGSPFLLLWPLCIRDSQLSDTVPFQCPRWCTGLEQPCAQLTLFLNLDYVGKWWWELQTDIWRSRWFLFLN